MKARLFLALWPSPETLERLRAFKASCTWSAGARLTPDRNLHVTLHFIGDVERERVPRLVDAFAEPTADVALRFDERELWGRGLAVLVASEVPDALSQLHSELALRLNQLELPVESRPYRPHVTLARDAGRVFPLAEAGPLEWHSSGHALVESADGEYRNVAMYR